MVNWLRESWPNLITLPTMCRKSSWCRIRKASEWHHKCFYLSRDVMTPGARQDSRIRCRTWAMCFLLRADLCRFRQGIYLRSFMRLLNKWFPSTCYCPLSNEELGESPCLPVSYTLVGDVGMHTDSVTAAELRVSLGAWRASGMTHASCDGVGVSVRNGKGGSGWAER